MPRQIKVALLTHSGGAHVSAYLNALAATDECSSVVLGDPDGRYEADAKRILAHQTVGLGRLAASGTDEGRTAQLVLDER